MYKKGAGNDKQGKDAGNRMLCPYRNFSQAIKSHIDWLAGPKILIVGLSFAELEMDKTVHFKLYLPLPGRCKQPQWNISIYHLIKDKFNPHGPAK